MPGKIPASFAGRIGCTLVLAAGSLPSAPATCAQVIHHDAAQSIALAASLQPYDVISVRENNGDPNSWGINIHEATLTATNVPLEAMIEFAYDIKSDLIFGLAGPVKEKRFDIAAKVLPRDGADAPPKLSDTQLAAMMISLLGDSFHLKAHLEPKTLPIYELVVLKGGPKLALSQGERTGGGWNINGENRNKVLAGKSATMTDLASMLSDEVHRKVIDKTGLGGWADITLKWTDDAADNEDTSILSIFTAVQEELGLRLQPSKGLVDTLVVDHVEMPSAN